MKKDMENMKNKESFITKTKNLPFSESLTVTIPFQKQNEDCST